jgi:hypothetical protein
MLTIHLLSHSFALSFVKLDGDFSHLLIYHKDEGWETENVEGTFATLYELLQHMQHFVNLVDSPQLVPDEHQSNAQRKFVTFLVEKHEFLGILFYRHSFSGLRLFRRVLLHTLIFLLLIGTNLIAYSVVDADCVKKAYCNAQCVEAHGTEQCAPRPDLRFNVTNQSRSRVTQYDSEIFLFPPVIGGTRDDRRGYEYCANIRNPLWALSVVCVPVCTDKINRFFSEDVFEWHLPAAANATCVNQPPSDVMACETKKSAPRLGSAPPVLSSCEGFVDGTPFTLITLLKSSVIAVFILICDQVITISLKLSQPIEWRTQDRRILLRKPTAVAISYVICFLFFAVATTFIGLGAWFMGGLRTLWEAAVIGLVISLVLKYFVFSPLRIWIWWLLLRFGIWKFLEGRTNNRANNRTMRSVPVSKTMRRIEKIMRVGVEDKKYAAKAEKRRQSGKYEAQSEMRSAREWQSEAKRDSGVHSAVEHEVKKHDKPREGRVVSSAPGQLEPVAPGPDEPTRLQSGTSRRKKKLTESGGDGGAAEAVEDVDGSSRGAQQLSRHKSLKRVTEEVPSERAPSERAPAAADDPDKPDAVTPSARKPRPTEPIAMRAAYMNTEMIEDQRDQTISFKQPATHAEMMAIAEDAAELFDRESKSFFTGPVCCTFLFLLVFLYVALGALVIVYNCGAKGVLSRESSIIVPVVTFVFAAVSIITFISVRVRRDKIGRCTLPIVTLCFVIGVLALGTMLILALVVNVTQCEPQLV